MSNLIYRQENTRRGDPMAEGRCMKCRKTVPILDGKEVTMKNGMSAMKGMCACGTAVFRILGKAKK